VDRDQLEPAVRFLEHGAGDEPADPPEAVDRNSGHSNYSNLSNIFGTIASTVKPKCLNRSSAGAEAPNRSRPILRPERPVWRSQPRVAPASIETSRASPGRISRR